MDRFCPHSGVKSKKSQTERVQEMQQLTIQKLSVVNRENAVNYLKQHGRPLEQALYAYHFEGGSVQAVIDELARFQNSDGGFGHALEADLRLDNSSVIATTVAMQRLGEIHAPHDHLVVKAACQYLRDTYEPERANWPIIPPNVDDAPHAPWWEYGGELSRSLANPRAEILGYLYEYPDQFDETMRAQVTESLMSHFLSGSDEIEMNEVHCYVRLCETPELPTDLKSQIVEKLKRVVDRAVARDPQEWHSYVLQPLSVVSHPDSPFAAQLTREVDTNLNFVIENQAKDGSWGPNWSWFGLYPDVWPIAERDWRSILTLNTLCTLAAFGRLA
jgi:hypothetical protein